MTQRTVLITGCSSGIGYDAAHGLRDAGWRVFASCRKASDCERLRGEGFDSPQIDYTDTNSIAAGLADVLAATGGTLDALYNNGAFACPGAVEDLPRGGLESIFQTNLFGVHDLTCRVIPVMRAQGHGRIVNCSSVLGLVGYKWRGAYVATKFALEGLTDVLRLEMRDTPIKVILLEPGPIASRIRENAIPHFERWFTPETSARAAQYPDLTKRLYEGGEDKFQLPASAVTAKLRHALEHPKPKARYYITVPTYLAAIMRRVLPVWAQDALISRN
ncbi:MAG: NAD(P)-dependent dehydrogenase (short-subunit alcohol dehydrogenase family) [Loktanella salsilacus]|jgi:NAD(P)-dependent dehydrogenase (short-subunit alcohol dehydrogenase family)|uniref:Short-chain dehydrogenase n=1 Tax=Loktanella salsilacus TaxID=195913 RepID=A0A1I4HFT1_9RHOB|nr:SDR family NAD(P)-dependent oxidoreductase [Loktanella salsilacus]UTH48393.1 SDR family NAD(P)-dependent oxidoreductase [Loktanella salsilacus]SFL41139.1 Short-chain dehydrogenase [Loktanella salsilacus]